jgi:hypothetical protein
MAFSSAVTGAFSRGEGFAAGTGVRLPAPAASAETACLSGRVSEASLNPTSSFGFSGSAMEGTAVDAGVLTAPAAVVGL